IVQASELLAAGSPLVLIAWLIYQARDAARFDVSALRESRKRRQVVRGRGHCCLQRILMGHTETSVRILLKPQQPIPQDSQFAQLLTHRPFHRSEIFS